TFDGCAHGAEPTIAIGRRSGDMIGITREAIADDFAVDLGATRLGTLVIFEHDNPSAFTHHEAITILVIRTRSRGRVIVEARGERPRCGKARQRQTVDTALSAAG